MKDYQGKAAFSGIAIGRIIEMATQEDTVRRKHIMDVQQELNRFRKARDLASEQLQILYQKAEKEVGATNAAIFEVHQMMLEDEDYIDSIINMIQTQEVNAEYAVAMTGDNFAGMFAAMDDAYMQGRAADVKDISARVVRVLNGTNETQALSDAGILVADDLAPSETVQLDKEKVLAFVTRQGSTNSHTAILARTMNIPAIVTTPVPQQFAGKMAIVDGFLGKLIVEPDEETLNIYRQQQQCELEKRRLLAELKGRPAVTKSGREIKLYANIGGVGDVGAALQNDAEGIGLFRSEFLYLQSDTYPTEEEQLKAYQQVAEMMAGKKVIIRTLDIGADKQIGYFNLGKEDNPAMGYRAVRICLTREDIFHTQLRALYRASAFGNISIMIPMIISLWEIRRVKEIISNVKQELEQQGISFGKVELGVMIETPAAVMISEELAQEVDFFSIGTNDLTQYTLAIDRQNERLDTFFDPHHPAILRMIEMTVTNAHKAGIWVGICGELGADTELTAAFVRMGIDELSVSHAFLLPVKKNIIDCD
ncbi:phosphoenolpyruvate--protein phosphotransferase [Anaerocolumna xylanovorans]|uniref:Phosphoenolpyruvate-protein phosphotransferase n=1 Tax=Anaerocolumna xylanovorans DSM 12503 TaxID=1121345 RepID=A0A1M7Y102_9FIRM|nr:phosphoenolpyruvate--protein phosphotransferase [Anaerocolumna xylanovorans]SHO45308.1 phosphotransferase system, enzyme I, PtsI [Anaerocolumna xylanovorans DSM 12503]